MNLALSLLAACERHPDEPALPGYTYAQLRESAARIAGGIELGRGDRAATFVDPPGHLHASAAYLKHLTSVVVTRALEQAL